MLAAGRKAASLLERGSEGLSGPGALRSGCTPYSAAKPLNPRATAAAVLQKYKPEENGSWEVTKYASEYGHLVFDIQQLLYFLSLAA